MFYHRTNPEAVQALTPELHLVGAIVQQVLHDAQRGRGDVRQEARDFLANPAHLRYWEDFLGLDDGALQRSVEDVLGA